MTIDMSETFALHLFMSFSQLLRQKGKLVSLNLLKNTIIMEEFDFYLDSKVTMWRRETFSIKATSINQATAMAIEAIKNGETHKYDPNHEEMYDTAEDMSIEENNGDPTLELFDNNSNRLIWDNTNNNSI